ncbi:MAG: tetratricopeptide repeat protein [Elusimicrobiota bacterium]
MSGRAVEDVRATPVSAPWSLRLSGVNPAVVLLASGLSIAFLFASLWFLLREKPLLRRPSVAASPVRAGDQIAAVQERLRQNPQDIGALVEMGIILFEQGRSSYVDAIGDLEEARDLGALDPRIFYCLGIMYQEEGLYPFALTEYKRFLRHYPDDKEVRMLTGKLYYRMGLFPDAVEEFERLKFQEPGDPLIDENLGLSLWGAKFIDRAAGTFAQLKTSGGDYSRRADYYLGQIALESGKVQDAYDHFVLIGNSEVPGLDAGKIQTGLAMAAQKLGKWDEAQMAWAAALRSSPGDAKANAALREVTRRAKAAKKAAEASEAAARRAAERAARAAAKNR